MIEGGRAATQPSPITRGGRLYGLVDMTVVITRRPIIASEGDLPRVARSSHPSSLPTFSLSDLTVLYCISTSCPDHPPPDVHTVINFFFH